MRTTFASLSEYELRALARGGAEVERPALEVVAGGSRKRLSTSWTSLPGIGPVLATLK